ncbi:hypothetical protein QQF64_025178 [Cirrhinus molitorella]|uniref:Uncharacterized protein n=1 Tax=Cirrhinus molitorella TaxID=172907 RepID=A0ABR3NNB4_9TELE
MMKPSGWLLSIEGHVVMGPHPFFLHGVAAFFSSYYVFNLEYPAAGSSTLEFIQRCFLGINPERGSKTKKRTTMNPHKLCSLSIFTYGCPNASGSEELFSPQDCQRLFSSSIIYGKFLGVQMQVLATA